MFLSLVSILFLLGLLFMVFLLCGVYAYMYGAFLMVEWELFYFVGLSLIFLLWLDWVSMMFLSVVFLISLVVFFYSSYYMSGDPTRKEFMILVGLFVASMMFLVLSPNLISILLGWDGLGVTSYSLVIYYHSSSAINGGMITLITNRLGDLIIFFVICWTLEFGGLTMLNLESMCNYMVYGLLGVLFFAATTKSAQIPFSAWLPAAMAAPTPVSSLVHSSTLVTAGVYLLIRFQGAYVINYYLLVVSFLTLMAAGVNALFEYDFKSIIALSTLSQLGFMVLALSLGLWELSFLHLLVHALFKSLLFMTGGVYIHGNKGAQDKRDHLEISIYSLVSVIYFFYSLSSLCALPFLSGFFSSDLITEMFYLGFEGSGVWMLMIFLLGLTGLYTLVMVYSSLLHFNKFLLSRGATTGGISNILFLFLYIGAIFGGGVMSLFLLPLYIFPLMWEVKLFLLMGLLVSFIGGLSVSYMEFTGGMLMIASFLGILMGLSWWTLSLPSKLLLEGLSGLKLVDQGWLEKVGGQGGIGISSLYSMWLTNMSLLGIKSIFISFLVLLFLILLL